MTHETAIALLMCLVVIEFMLADESSSAQNFVIRYFRHFREEV